MVSGIVVFVVLLHSYDAVGSAGTQADGVSVLIDAMMRCSALGAAHQVTAAPFAPCSAVFYSNGSNLTRICGNIWIRVPADFLGGVETGVAMAASGPAGRGAGRRVGSHRSRSPSCRVASVGPARLPTSLLPAIIGMYALVVTFVLPVASSR